MNEYEVRTDICGYTVVLPHRDDPEYFEEVCSCLRRTRAEEIAHLLNKQLPHENDE